MATELRVPILDAASSGVSAAFEQVEERREDQDSEDGYKYVKLFPVRVRQAESCWRHDL